MRRAEEDGLGLEVVPGPHRLHGHLVLAGECQVREDDIVFLRREGKEARGAAPRARGQEALLPSHTGLASHRQELLPLAFGQDKVSVCPSTRSVTWTRQVGAGLGESGQ